MMHAVRTAAEAVAARDVIEEATLAERFFTALRIRQSALDDDTIALAVRLNEMLQVEIDQVGRAANSRDQALFDEVERMTRSLDDRAPSFKA